MRPSYYSRFSQRNFNNEFNRNPLFQISLHQSQIRRPVVQNEAGLTKEEIDQFPIAEWKEINKGKEVDQCVICLDEFKRKEILRTLFCLHRFHKKCIDKWLKDKIKCPSCNQDMREILKKGSGLRRDSWMR